MENPEKPSAEPSLKGFWGLAGLQYQGAFSDGAFKQLLLLIVLERFVGDESLKGRWTAITAAMVALPYLLLSGWTGSLADRFSKRSVILGTKAAELLIMTLGAVALYFYSSPDYATTPAFYAAIGVLFLMGSQTAFFSPSKYGSLPEILPAHKLSWGNGVLELMLYVGMVTGVLVANEVYGQLGGKNLHLISLGLVALSLAGLAAGWFIPRIPAARADAKIRNFSLIASNLRLIVRDRVLAVTILGISFFWFIGALIVWSNVAVWGQHYLGLSETAAGRLPIYMFIGIGLGAFAVAALSRRGTEIGFVPLGALGIAIFTLPLALLPPVAAAAGGEHGDGPAPWITGVMLFCLGVTAFSAGFYVIPLNATLQEKADPKLRGSLWATLNFVNFTCVLGAAILYFCLIGPFHFTSANVFAVASILTLATAVYLVTVMPEMLLGLVSTLVTRFLFRIRVLGGANIPKEGGALLVSNNVSIVDALLLQSLTPRPIRFIVWKELFDSPLLGLFLRIMRAIPVSSDQRPRALIAALSKAGQALDEGELVCVFIEGQITRAGLPMPYTRGFKHVMKNSPVPIVPIYIDGVWGSIFKYERKKHTWKWPRRLRDPIRLAVGKPLSPDCSTHEMRQSVSALSADCAMLKKDLVPPIHHGFVRFARRHWRHFCVGDLRTPPLKFGRALIGSVVLARKLRSVWGNQEMVGIYLPPSVGGVLVNAAAALSGRTAVNLNYTVGPDILKYCIDKCGLKTVITSKLFLEKLGQEPPPGAYFIDDLSKSVKLPDKLLAFLGARFLPIRMLEKFCGAAKNPTPDTLATIIFSSGSTGVPKGVMLTHFNIASNIESIERHVSLWPDDRLVGFLPFFHSFGYTVSLWASLNIGFGVIHHPNPLEAQAIGDICEKYGVTVMIATPTFLQSYIRRIEPEKFQTIEFVLTGAEKLPARVVDGFDERFGIYVHEGYGTTECAPVVAANIDEYRSRGASAITNKRGSVGHPVPGVAVRITDVDTGRVMGAGERGMIEVRGANIMQGYLDLPDKTAEALRDGWYVTGDVGYLDDDGFLFITDRLARFSKIGGEMVPHLGIEDELHKAVAATEQIFAVTAVPDESKGERIAVVHTADESVIETLGEKLAAAGLPNLWIPRPKMFFKVDALPVLGTGKLDLAAVRKIARARAGGEEPAPAGSAPPPSPSPVPPAAEAAPDPVPAPAPPAASSNGGAAASNGAPASAETEAKSGAPFTIDEP